MLERILIPLDGSAVAELILPHAQRWAQASGRGLLLLSVLRPPRVPDPLTGTIREPATVPYPAWAGEQRRAHTYLEGLAARLSADGPRAQVMIRDGDPATEIVSVAAGEPGIVGVAMTTHGRRGLPRLWFGSVAEKVVLTSPRPLLVVHPPAGDPPRAPAPTPYHHILVPLDGTHDAERALPVAQDLAQASHATLTLALVEVAGEPDDRVDLVWRPPEVLMDHRSARDYLERVARRLRAGGRAVDTQVLSGPPASVMARFSETTWADLVIMAPHARSGLDRMIHGSVAWHVVQQATRPVLLVHC